MNYGLYLSASGVLVNMHRQDVIANNLANAGTPGFKGQLAAFQQRPVEVREDATPAAMKQDLLDRIGGGLFVHRSRFNLADGPLKKTGGDLDLALTGDGFFAVSVDQPGGRSQVRLTRDGRMTLTPEGTLATQTGRHPVLDVYNRPVRLDPSQPVQINSDGTIIQDGGAVTRLAVTQVPDPVALEHLGHGLYTAPAGQLDQRRPGDAQVLQGWLEMSNVDPINQLVEMIETTRAITDNANLIRYHDTTIDRAVNVLGRVS